MKRIAIIVALLASATLIARAQAQAEFTASQAGSGARVYRQHCMYCHGLQLQGRNGVPALIGSAFRNQFSSAKAIYDFASSTMPASNPGVLTKQEYLDVTAYILSKNGHRPGTQPLTLSSVGEPARR